MSSPKLSIIIVAFNCCDLLDACLRSISASDYQVYEIIVIDNASVDGVKQMLKSRHQHLRLIENDANVGHVRAVNQGIKAATGEYALLLDADTELLPDAIRHMMDYARSCKERVWLVAPKTLNGDGSVQRTARNFPSPINAVFGRQSLLTRFFPNNPFTRKYLGARLDDDAPFMVEFVSSACMLFSLHITVPAVGLWDEGYAGYWADADWCKRIQKSGGLIGCVPRSVIYHLEQNKSNRKANPRRIIMFHKGAFRFYRLYYTMGWCDPRTLLGALLLAGRTVLLMAWNELKSQTGKNIDPLSLKR